MRHRAGEAFNCAPGLTETARGLGRALLNIMDGETFRCDRSGLWLAAYLDKSEKSVRNAKRLLRKLSALDWENRGTRNGNHMSSYHFNWELLDKWAAEGKQRAWAAVDQARADPETTFRFDDGAQDGKAAIPGRHPEATFRSNRKPGSSDSSPIRPIESAQGRQPDLQLGLPPLPVPKDHRKPQYMKWRSGKWHLWVIVPRQMRSFDPRPIADYSLGTADEAVAERRRDLALDALQRGWGELLTGKAWPDVQAELNAAMARIRTAAGPVLAIVTTAADQADEGGSSIIEPKPAPAVRRADPQPRETRLPAEFQPDIALAIDAGLSPEEARKSADKFRSYWAGEGGARARKADWSEAWRYWVLGDVEGRPKQRAGGSSSGSTVAAAKRLMSRDNPPGGHDDQ